MPLDHTLTLTLGTLGAPGEQHRVVALLLLTESARSPLQEITGDAVLFDLHPSVLEHPRNRQRMLGPQTLSDSCVSRVEMLVALH